MRKFTALCRDTVTGHRMVLSDCSFNAACMYLEGLNADNKLGEYKGTECGSRDVVKLVFENALFLYDEARGYLMRVC
jgi:hypothetical protein